GRFVRADYATVVAVRQQVEIFDGLTGARDHDRTLVLRDLQQARDAIAGDAGVHREQGRVGGLSAEQGRRGAVRIRSAEGLGRSGGRGGPRRRAPERERQGGTAQPSQGTADLHGAGSPRRTCPFWNSANNQKSPTPRESASNSAVV